MYRNAYDIIRVESWVKFFCPSIEFEICAEPYKGRWRCEIELPRINKTVDAISDTESDAMLDAAKKAVVLVEKYIAAHPDKEYDPNFGKNWELEQDDQGHFLGYITRDENGNIRMPESIKRSGACRKAIEFAINKVSNILGSAKGLYIQVLDKNLFDEKLNLTDVEQMVWEEYADKYGMDLEHPQFVQAKVTDDSYIFIFYQKQDWLDFPDEDASHLN